MSGAIAELWHERKLLAPAFAAANGVGFLPLLVLPWALGELISSGAYSASVAGWISTAEISALAVSSWVCAKRATQPGRRWIAAFGTAIALLANLLAMLGPQTTLFVVARVVSGAGLGCAVAVGNAAASGSANPARAFAGLWFGMALWQLLIFNLTPWVVGHAGVAGAYGLIVAGCSLFLPLILRTPDPRPGITVEQCSPGGVLRWLPAALMMLAFVTFWLRDALVYSLSQILAVARGISGQQLGQLLGVASVVGLAGPALATRFSEYRTHARALVIGLIIVLASSLAIVGGNSASSMMGGVLIMPLTGLFATPLLSGLAARIDSSGRLPAICAGAGFLSQAFGAAVGASLMEASGSRGLELAVLMAGITTLASVLWITHMISATNSDGSLRMR